VEVTLTDAGPAAFSSAAKPAGSRTRAMSAARCAGVVETSSQPRSGRITSRPISSPRAPPRLCHTARLPSAIRPASFSHRSAVSRQSWPATARQPARHQSCQEEPGCASSQSSMRSTPSRRK